VRQKDDQGRKRIWLTACIAPGVAEAGFVREDGAWAAEGDEDDD
jgi:hypothetical protein